VEVEIVFHKGAHQPRLRLRLRSLLTAGKLECLVLAVVLVNKLERTSAEEAMVRLPMLRNVVDLSHRLLNRVLLLLVVFRMPGILRLGADAASIAVVELKPVHWSVRWLEVDKLWRIRFAIQPKHLRRVKVVTNKTVRLHGNIRVGVNVRLLVAMMEFNHEQRLVIKLKMVDLLSFHLLFAPTKKRSLKVVIALLVQRTVGFMELGAAAALPAAVELKRIKPIVFLLSVLPLITVFVLVHR